MCWWEDSFNMELRLNSLCFLTRRSGTTGLNFRCLRNMFMTSTTNKLAILMSKTPQMSLLLGTDFCAQSCFIVSKLILSSITTFEHLTSYELCPRSWQRSLQQYVNISLLKIKLFSNYIPLQWMSWKIKLNTRKSYHKCGE